MSDLAVSVALNQITQAESVETARSLPLPVLLWVVLTS